ncbi:MAG: PSD1 and planctomycete cytochrome C domain-containing protein [Planctomycetota bacterium]
MLSFLLAVCTAGLLQDAVSPTDDRVDFFERHIRPVLVERCYSCHSSEARRLRAALRLDSREGLLSGGERGPAIVPGRPEDSLLIRALRHEDDLAMPPRGRLTDAQIAAFVHWVEQGAIDPRESDASLEPTSAEPHWSFILPQRAEVPQPKGASWARTPVDAFILEALEAKGLQPAPEADARTLIRRATYDLTGLPPSPEEVDAYVADTREDAYERLIDRLLASPHYGEQWGRHWLDVARYADTKGYVYDRQEARFVQAYRYRDWVIRAFNDDLPYDELLIAQIAADRLRPTEPSRLPALGFLTLGQRFLGNPHDIIDDRIDVVTRGTMGLTVSCARCHDHKFDPIPAADYYSLYGIFAGTTERLVNLEAEPEVTEAYRRFAAGLEERERKLEELRQTKCRELEDRLRGRVTEYLLASLDRDSLPPESFYAILGPDDINPAIVRAWHRYLTESARGFDPIFGPLHRLAEASEEDFASRAAALASELHDPEKLSGKLNAHVDRLFRDEPPKSIEEVARRYGQLLGSVADTWRSEVEQASARGESPPEALPDPAQEALRQVLYASGSPVTVSTLAPSDVEPFFDEPTRVQLAQLQADIERWILGSEGAPPHALSLEDRPVQRTARIFRRGDPNRPEDEVSRRFLSALPAPGVDFDNESGRLALARAIASPRNPLTARVLVNRVWHHHFGQGLVRTPSDFGARGERPSHPELLDNLAVQFMESGWSIKQLHRLLMLSSVYRQASDGHPAFEAIDPENRLLWRMNRRRLELEELRDTLLAVSGQLDPQLYGAPVELTAQASPGRRTLYGFIDRRDLPALYRTFDFASPDQHSPKRHATTVPQQALFLLNDSFVIERARDLARLVQAPESTPDVIIQRLYAAALQRSPTAEEQALAQRFLREAAVEAPTPMPPSPWLYGYGALNAATLRIESFELLPHFTGDTWRGGPELPDAALGWVTLTKDGGHPGNDLGHAAIRRFVAPRDLVLSVEGTLAHAHPQGDGFRAHIESSTDGVLAIWSLHQQQAQTSLGPITLPAGATLDFVVDVRDNLGWDEFTWTVSLREVGDASGAAPEAWRSEADFRGPSPPDPLTALEKLAQVLLLSNELAFVD